MGRARMPRDAPQGARIMSISGFSRDPQARIRGTPGAHQEHDAPQRAGIGP